MERKIVLTPLDIYKLLEKNNCKRCMLPSCLAFAAAVIGGQKQLSDCPLLSESNRALLSENLIQRSRAEPEQPAFMAKLLRKVRTLDFDLIAKLVGGEYDPENDTISIRSLGKHFYVDRGGVCNQRSKNQQKQRIKTLINSAAQTSAYQEFPTADFLRPIPEIF